MPVRCPFTRMARFPTLRVKVSYEIVDIHFGRVSPRTHTFSCRCRPRTNKMATCLLSDRVCRQSSRCSGTEKKCVGTFVLLKIGNAVSWRYITRPCDSKRSSRVPLAYALHNECCVHLLSYRSSDDATFVSQALVSDGPCAHALASCLRNA